MMSRAMMVAMAMLLLTGCQQDALLKAENAELREQLAAQAGTRAAELAHLRQQASIASACAVGVQVCPESARAEGERAIARGVAGGGWQFWAAIMVKAMLVIGVLAAGIGAGIGAGVAVYRKVGPSDEEIADAQRKIDTARAVTKQIEASKVELFGLQSKIKTATGQLGEAENKLEKIQAEIDFAEKNRGEAANAANVLTAAFSTRAKK